MMLRMVILMIMMMMAIKMTKLMLVMMRRRTRTTVTKASTRLASRATPLLSGKLTWLLSMGMERETMKLMVLLKIWQW